MRMSLLIILTLPPAPQDPTTTITPTLRLTLSHLTRGKEDTALTRWKEGTAPTSGKEDTALTREKEGTALTRERSVHVTPTPDMGARSQGGEGRRDATTRRGRGRGHGDGTGIQEATFT